MGKIAARSSGPMGCFVAGCSGGPGRFGMSAIMLYHLEGISLSDNTIFVSLITPPSKGFIFFHYTLFTGKAPCFLA
jgi:hypothetical protein